jgi:hypothetical protein
MWTVAWEYPDFRKGSAWFPTYADAEAFEATLADKDCTVCSWYTPE